MDEKDPKYVLRLFIQRSTPRATLAINNLRKLTAKYLSSIDFEVIDVNEQPAEAERHRILATPTLLKLSPPPVRRIIGDLTDLDKVVIGLDLPIQPVSTEDLL